MTLVNVIVAVLLCLAALLITVWFLSLSVRVVYKNELFVYAGVGPFSIRLVPPKPKKEKAKKHDKRKKKEKNSSDNNTAVKKDDTDAVNEKGGSEKEDSKKMTVGEVLGTVRSIVEEVLNLFHKKAKIRIDALNVVVSKPDAADTAIQFGICSGIVTAILAFSKLFGKSVIRDENVSVVPDFISGKSRIETDITLSVRVCHAVTAFIKILIKRILKGK